MSKVLLINGSPHEHGCTYTALKEVAGALERGGVETEILYLGTKPISGCTACGACHKTGRCVIDDKVDQVLDRLDQYQGLVVGSPVYFAGPTAQLCAFMERLFYAGAAKLDGKLGAAVVSCRRGGAATAFQRLNLFFNISNMQQVGSQYWNQVHGSKPEDVLKDQEGMQTMRALGDNMAWQIRCQEAAGIPKPEREPRLKTNFIR